MRKIDELKELKNMDSKITAKSLRLEYESLKRKNLGKYYKFVVTCHKCKQLYGLDYLYEYQKHVCRKCMFNKSRQLPIHRHAPVPADMEIDLGDRMIKMKTAVLE